MYLIVTVIGGNKLIFVLILPSVQSHFDNIHFIRPLFVSGNFQNSQIHVTELDLKFVHVIKGEVGWGEGDTADKTYRKVTGPHLLWSGNPLPYHIYNRPECNGCRRNYFYNGIRCRGTLQQNQEREQKSSQNEQSTAERTLGVNQQITFLWPNTLCAT